MIYITSDWHFSHERDFIFKPRGFDNQNEMNNAIIENYNAIVKDDDDVYCLGDLMLNDNAEGMKCLNSLKGHIHIIRGNHDTSARIELYKSCPNVVEVCDAKYLSYGKYNFFLSHYPSLTSNCDDDKPLHKRLINLCGHLHTSDRFMDMDKGLIYHCEVDAHNNKPVSIEEILKDLKEYSEGVGV